MVVFIQSPTSDFFDHFWKDGNNDIGKEGHCLSQIMFRGYCRVQWVRMINAQQLGVSLERMLLCPDIIQRMNKKTSPFIAGFVIVDRGPGLSYSFAIIYPKQKTAAFIRKILQTMFENTVENVFLNSDLHTYRLRDARRSPYLSALSGNKVTIDPDCSEAANRVAPARLAAAEGLSNNPSWRATNRMRS